MGWFWSETPKDNLSKPLGHPKGDISQCPIDHSKFTQQFEKKKVESETTSKCPVDHTQRSSWFSFAKPSGPDAANNKINPLNMMPDLSSQRAPGQTVDLPLERTMSTIPKGKESSSGVWEYPSPQQMYNAMLRKGGGEIPEDAVESMVDVHNFLNEGAWVEICDWERKYSEKTDVEPRLMKFQGRPNDISPRAQMIQVLGKVFPATFGSAAPFDRHDWTVLRAVDPAATETDTKWKEVRYVIDYYAGDDEGDSPTFVLDVRPALDSPGAAYDRVAKWGSETWRKAAGLPPVPKYVPLNLREDDE
ncbi:Cytochrome c heme lyase [Yarrowia sp. B02]|nr:Cytochrome c heme lyase [Yarrowia sp. B02]